MGKCKKCGCKGYFWNPVSAAQKGLSGFSLSFEFKNKKLWGGGSPGFMAYQDNKSDQVGYRNCTCGHHYNYHDK